MTVTIKLVLLVLSALSFAVNALPPPASPRRFNLDAAGKAFFVASFCVPI